MRLLPLLVAILMAMPVSAPAEDRAALGIGRLFTNDFLGDGSDRWQTGSYVISALRGDPVNPVFREYRLQSQIVSPDGRRDDRPYAGVLTAGIARHVLDGPMHYTLGADVVVIGPQTGLADLQADFHDRFDMPAPFTDNQLPDQVVVQARASATATAQLSDTLSVRPFVAGRAGAEDVFRVGADILIGPVGQSDVWLRDDVTGQLYRGTQGAQTGFSYSVGADIGRVGDSVFLPETDVAAGQRRRARAGVHWQPTEDTSFFYGVTYLSEEFQGQTEGQVVGSLTLNFSF